MTRRTLLQLSGLIAAGPILLQGKSPEWQSGEVAGMDVIRTPVGKGKKIMYRYSYALHANGRSYTFDETKKLPLTINGPVRFAVAGDKIRVVDERGKEHKETILQKAIDKPQ